MSDNEHAANLRVILKRLLNSEMPNDELLQIEQAIAEIERLEQLNATKDRIINAARADYADLRAKVGKCEEALKRAHACATVDPHTGECDGCFVSAALAAVEGKA